MMFKILLILSLISTAGAGVAGYKAGGDYVRAKMSKEIEGERKTQSEKIEKLIMSNKIKRVVYRDKIKIIKTTIDPTGCTDTNIPNDIFNKL